MTVRTFALIIKMKKDYLVEFIRKIEKLPKVGVINDDLTQEQIIEYDKFYKTIFGDNSKKLDKHISNGDIKCEKCGAEACYIYNTDEIEFSYDGTGHYYADCHCRRCDHDFRKYYSFKYEVTADN